MRWNQALNFLCADLKDVKILKTANLELKSSQRKYLRSQAHNLKPVVQIGQKGISDSIVQTVADALNQHELIKVKFIEDKEKESKQQMIEMLLAKSPGVHLVGMIGHTVILYKQSDDPEKRRIVLPN